MEEEEGSADLLLSQQQPLSRKTEERKKFEQPYNHDVVQTVLALTHFPLLSVRPSVSLPKTDRQTVARRASERTDLKAAVQRARD